MTYRHLVLFRVHDDADEAALREALRRLDALGTVPGVLEWTVRESDDARKGRVVVENALLESRAAFDAFRAHPFHAQATAAWRDVADWWVGDYEESERA